MHYRETGIMILLINRWLERHAIVPRFQSLPPGLRPDSGYSSENKWQQRRDRDLDQEELWACLGRMCVRRHMLAIVFLLPDPSLSRFALLFYQQRNTLQSD